MNDLTLMTRLEVIVPARDAPEIRELITKAGATGFTSVSGVSGLGHHGQHSGALLFNEYDTLTMLITVLPPEKASELIEAIQEMLKSSSGVMFVAETFVSRPDYFQSCNRHPRQCDNCNPRSSAPCLFARTSPT